MTDIPRISSAHREEAPAWAVLEWRLIRRMEEAVEVFLDQYVRPDGTLYWRDFWPGMDGSDDAFEAFQNYPLFYALGAGKRLLELGHHEWDSMSWQWTQYGQIDREFFGYYDWMHHGEGSLFLYYMGLADPASLKFRMRTERFAGFYTDRDELARNYDPALRLIRAPITGSCGPRFHHTAEDWQTHREVLDNYLPPFEDMPGIPFIQGKCDWSGGDTYKTILRFINERMAKGDVPLNLNATSLMTHAYLYTGEETYKTWVLDYLSAWAERTRQNGGIIPDNIGLRGDIGENMDGKWWGGYYGWRWPHGALTVIEPLITAGCNALLLTGDDGWLNLARSQLDMLYELRRPDEQGLPTVPHRHFDTGWADYRRENTKWPVYLWSVTQSASDRARIDRLPEQNKWDVVPTRLQKGNRMDIHPWFHYLGGDNPNFPEQALRANLGAVEERLRQIAGDSDDCNTTDIHHWQDKNPVVCEALVQLMLGGPTNIYHGGLLFTALRYFTGGRPGLPDGVGALVEKVGPTDIIVRFHNTADMVHSFTLQGGCFGEHRLERALILDSSDETSESVEIGGKYLELELDAHSGLALKLEFTRFSQKPSYLLPGMTEADIPSPIQPRRQVPEDADVMDLISQ